MSIELSGNEKYLNDKIKKVERKTKELYVLIFLLLTGTLFSVLGLFSLIVNCY